MLRILIVSLFISSAILNSSGIYFQSHNLYENSEEKKSGLSLYLKSFEFIIQENAGKSVNEQFVQKSERSVQMIHIWKNVQKIAFSCKDLDSSIRSLKSVYYKVRLFSSPDICFPFDYFL